MTGIFAGFGSGFFGTTADSVADLGDPFHVISPNLGLGIGLSFQLAWGGGNVVVAASPPFLGWGAGIGANIYDTNTMDTSMLNRCE